MRPNYLDSAQRHPAAPQAIQLHIDGSQRNVSSRLVALLMQRFAARLLDAVEGIPILFLSERPGLCSSPSPHPKPIHPKSPHPPQLWCTAALSITGAAVGADAEHRTDWQDTMRQHLPRVDIYNKKQQEMVLTALSGTQQRIQGSSRNISYKRTLCKRKQEHLKFRNGTEPRYWSKTLWRKEHLHHKVIEQNLYSRNRRGSDGTQWLCLNPHTARAKSQRKSAK